MFHDVLILYFLICQSRQFGWIRMVIVEGAVKSPIDIDTEKAHYDSNLADLVFTGCTTWQNFANNATIENNGHSSE